MEKEVIERKFCDWPSNSLNYEKQILEEDEDENFESPIILTDELVLQNVLHFLSPKDILNLTLVNKRWRDVSLEYDVWNKLIISYFAEARYMDQSNHIQTIMAPEFRMKMFFLVKFFAGNMKMKKSEEKRMIHILPIRTLQTVEHSNNVSKLFRSSTSNITHFNFFEIQFLKPGFEVMFGLSDSIGKSKYVIILYDPRRRSGKEPYIGRNGTINLGCCDHLGFITDRIRQTASFYVNGQKVHHFEGVTNRVETSLIFRTDSQYQEHKNSILIRRRRFRLNYWRDIVPLSTRDLSDQLLKNTFQIHEIPSKNIKRMKILGKQVIGTRSSFYLCKWKDLGGGMTVVGKEYGASTPLDVIRNEINTFISFDYPLIRRVYGYTKYEGKYMLVMEHIHQTLQMMYTSLGPKDEEERRKYLQVVLDDDDSVHIRLSYYERYRLIKMMCRGLNYLHIKNIVHKNFTSRSCLVTKSGTYVKITGFSHNSSEKLSIHERNYRWTAPELLIHDDDFDHHDEDGNNESKAPPYTRKSDIFALGMTIYELMVFGLPFFKVSSNKEVKKLIMAGERPKEWPADIPPKFKKLITMCWNQDPSKRPHITRILDYLNKHRTKFIGKSNEDELKDVESQIGISDLKIIKRLGFGASGEVFKGMRRDTGEMIAVKKIYYEGKFSSGDDVSRKSLTLDESSSNNTFLRSTKTMSPKARGLRDAELEIQFLQRFQHPNIVRYLGSERVSEHSDSVSESVDNIFYIFLEFCEGGAIDDFFNSNFPNLRSRVEPLQLYLRQILEGLKYLHEKGACHRDLKPKNILLTNKGQVKIIDFGSTKTIQSKIRSQEEHEDLMNQTLIGTAPFICPELIENNNHFPLIPFSFDIWSLGVTIVNLLTGRHLFASRQRTGGETRFQVLKRISNLKRSPEIPEEVTHPLLHDLISQCLQIDPRNRSTAKELLDHSFFKCKIEPEVLEEEEGEEEDDDRSTTTNKQVPQSFAVASHRRKSFLRVDRFRRWVRFFIHISKIVENVDQEQEKVKKNKKKKKKKKKNKYYLHQVKKELKEFGKSKKKKNLRFTYLVMTVSKRFDFYIHEIKSSIEEVEKPVFSTYPRKFKVLNRKDCTMEVLCEYVFNDPEDRSKSYLFNLLLQIRFVNHVDLSDLERLLIQSQVEEIVSGDTTVNLQPPKKRTKSLLKEKRRSSSVWKLRDGQSEKLEKSRVQKVKDWSHQELVEWSRSVFCDTSFKNTLYDYFGKYFEEIKLDGTSLLEWRLGKEAESEKNKNIEEMLRRSQIVPVRFRTKLVIRKKFNSILLNGTYDPISDVVTRKVIKMCHKRNLPLEYPKIRKVVLEFSDVKIAEKKILGLLYENEEDAFRGGVFSVKLNIVKTAGQSSQNSTMRRFYGAMIKVRDRIGDEKDSTKFGFYHASVSIGGLCVEWVDSSLCIIRSNVSSNVVLSLDVANLDVQNGLIFSKRLAETCLRWNSVMKYNTYSMIKNASDEANCQQFSMYILTKHLEIPFTLSKKVRQFTNSIKFKGSCEAVDFIYTSSFAKWFFSPNDPRRNRREFRPKTHVELDLFVQDLFRKCPTFDRDYNDEYMLLKGFDRAFWMKFFKVEKNREDVNSDSRSKYGPARRVDSINWRLSGCPFTPPEKI